MDITTNQNLLTHLESISSAAASCELNFENLGSVSNDIKEVSDFLGITAGQSVFFSCLAVLNFKRAVNLECLSNHLKCSVIKLITLIHEIEALEQKKYIRRSSKKGASVYSYNDITFDVHHHVIEALRKGDSSMLVGSSSLDLPSFLRRMSSLVFEREECSIPTARILAEAELLISSNRDIPYVSFIDSALSLTVSKCMVFAISWGRLWGQINSNIYFYSGALLEDIAEQFDLAELLASGNHELVTGNILQVVESKHKGLYVELTEASLNVLYRDYPALLASSPSAQEETPVPNTEKDVIRCETLIPKKLFFSGEVKEQLDSLAEVLGKRRFSQYRTELKRNKLSSGVTAIFHGGPGTGKTESVYQLALKTGRDIMMVDLSETKDKWIGDCERLAKKIFDDYAALLESSDIEPILFINEADGLFSTRFDISTQLNQTIAQAYNTAQNILLQELEKFEGILLATTNLNKNLDSAYERRFTFKIFFSKPDARARQGIWRSKIPELSARDAAVLAEKFDMSGGEIDVQVRKVLMKKVLRKKVDLFEMLLECCSTEHGFSSKKRKVGFVS
jgi:hypothetical protein